MYVSFLLTTTGLYLRPLTVLLALEIEQLLIEIVIVIENQYLQHVHAFSTYHCVVIIMQSQDLNNNFFFLPFYYILIYISKFHHGNLLIIFWAVLYHINCLLC